MCCTISGGAVSSGLGIYDTMQYIQPPVATWCVGQCCSMGSLLLASGATGMRYSLPNSKIMLHQPSGGFKVSILFSKFDNNWIYVQYLVLYLRKHILLFLIHALHNGLPRNSFVFRHLFNGSKAHR